MKRRSFLQWVVAAPLIARVAPVLPKTTPDFKEIWFDQAAFEPIPFRPPPSVLLEQLELIERTKVRMVSISRVMWAEQCRPALEEVFSREYDRLDGKEWKKLWLGEWEIGNDVSTKSL